MTDTTGATTNAVETTLLVSGMTCGHCVSSVTEEVSTLAGVQNVTVALEPAGTSTVTVISDAVLEPTALRAAITEAGYELVSA